MQINQTEIKDLKAVITLTLEPADYQEEVNKQLKQVRQKVRVWYLPASLRKCTARESWPTC